MAAINKIPLLKTPIVNNRQPAMNYRPKFRLYHPNGKGTGCALSMELHPAHDDTEGSMILVLAPQKSVGNLRNASNRVFPTFDWENAIRTKLGFSDLCRILQVLRGETESIEDGRGLFHRSVHFNTKISFRHVVTPHSGYLLEVARNTIGKTDEDRYVCFMFSDMEAFGIQVALNTVLGVVCFGIPMVIPHNTRTVDTEENSVNDERAASRSC